MAIFASDANTDEPTRMLVVLSPGQLKPSAGGKHVEAIWKFMVSQCSWFLPRKFCRYSQVDPIFKHPRPHLLVLTARLLRAWCSSKMEPNARHLTGSYLQRDGSQQKIRCEHGWFGGPRLGTPLLCWGVPKSWENLLNSIVQKIKKSPCLAWWVVFMIFGQAKQNAFLEGKEFACFFVGTLKSCSTAMPLWPWRVEVDC